MLGADHDGAARLGAGPRNLLVAPRWRYCCRRPARPKGASLPVRSAGNHCDAIRLTVRPVAGRRSVAVAPLVWGAEYRALQAVSEGWREAACNEAGLGEVALQPMSICYTAQQGLPMARVAQPVVAWYGDLDFFPHFAAFIRRGIVTVTVSFGAPVTCTAATDRKLMAKELEMAVRHMTVDALRHRTVNASS